MSCPAHGILGKNLTFTIQSRSGTGAAADADSLPTYKVYEEETGTAIVTGTMAKLDDAGTTGFYSEQLAISAANGYEVYKTYTIRILSVIGGVTVPSTESFILIGSVISAAVVTSGDGATLEELKNICKSHGWHDTTTAGLVQLKNFINHTIQLLTTLAPWPEYHKVNGVANFAALVSSTINDASATTTSFDTDLTSATDDIYNNRNVYFTSGNLDGQFRRITDYNGTTKVVTVSPAFSEAPADDDTFTIYANQEQLSETSIIRVGVVVRNNRATPLDEITPEEWLHSTTYLKGIGSPTQYALLKYTSSGATKVDMAVYPKPTTAINLYYTYQTEANELSVDADQTTWPNNRTWLLADALRIRLAAVDKDPAGAALYSIDFTSKVNRAFNQARPSYMPIQAKGYVGRPGKWSMRDINRHNAVFA